MDDSEMPLVPRRPRSLIYTETASYLRERLDSGSVLRFPKLPPEIRLKIWHHAMSIPNIDEVVLNEKWILKNAIPLPPLLSACRESRRECLDAYNTENDRSGVEWMQFDLNILFFKDLDFCDAFEQPRFTEYIQRWDPKEWLDTDKSNKWKGRPQFFDKVHALAVHRDVLTQTADDYECIIRHFFPNLNFLVVLIDDGIAIDKAWNVENADFKVYENDWEELPPRWEFTNASTAPFTIVSVENKAYENYIEKEMKQRFEREEKDYKGYVAPALRVMGCWLPPGVKIPECGRWPDDWSGDVRTLVVEKDE